MLSVGVGGGRVRIKWAYRRNGCEIGILVGMPTWWFSTGIFQPFTHTIPT
jgi:hypothetical protein